MQAASTSNVHTGNCRCCLTKGNHQHLEEVNVEVLECLNLFIVADPRLTQLICAACVTFLTDVSRFRKMVTSSERLLLRAIKDNKQTVFVNVSADGTSLDLQVKEEASDVKAEEFNDCLDSTILHLENMPAVDVIAENKDGASFKTEIELSPIYHNDLEEFEDVTLLSKRSMRKRHIRDGKMKSKKDDSESDTPIAQINEKNAKVKKKNQRKEKIEPNPSKTIHTKQDALKDNNKIRANIILILKHSTILPFRNTFRTTYKCFYCDNLYIPFKELKEHIETDHNDVCETTIDRGLRSLQDLILSADISFIKCRLCFEEFKTIDGLTKHLTNVHKKIYYDTVRKPSHGILGFDLSSDTLKCHVCNKEFAFFKNLSVHMNDHYGLFVCYICGKKFLSEHRYNCHVDHHEHKKTKCKHCGENFKSEASMMYHIRKEHLKRTIKCLKCPETFGFSQYIKRLNHMAAVHGIKKPVFKCDTCGKEYANSGSLAAHKRSTHKRAKEHRCDICGYITVHSNAMKNHMLVHNGVKNYECEFCKKKFAKPYTLKLHLRIHLNDKRFVCSLCDAAFIQKNSLKNHVKTRHPDSGIDISKL